jgi:simple sugar transport system permease protein
LGPVLFTQDPITYLAWLAIPLTWLVMRRTRFGIRLRACGDNEAVATGAGIKVSKTRELSTIIAGAAAALGGAQLALVSVQLFNKDMTAGRGYLALAAFYFGRSRPGMTAVAAILFGLADSYSLRLQTQGLPDQLPEMVPYLVVIVALVVVAIRDHIRRGHIASAQDTGDPTVLATSSSGTTA